MSDDFDSFAAPEGGEPPDGNHTATLVRAKVGNSQAGDRLVILEWQTEDFAYYWTTFHGVNGGAKAFTQRILGKILDTDDLREFGSWEGIGAALADREDTAYAVNVTRNGNYLNIKVLERSQGVQTAIPVEEPAPAQVAPASVFDDDDIPF
jgi:hypothetical protein